MDAEQTETERHCNSLYSVANRFDPPDSTLDQRSIKMCLDARGHMRAMRTELNAAMSLIRLRGVPESRAATLPVAIDVLFSRLDKEIRLLKAEIAELIIDKNRLDFMQDRLKRRTEINDPSESTPRIGNAWAIVSAGDSLRDAVDAVSDYQLRTEGSK